jgi:hypothetical protein
MNDTFERKVITPAEREARKAFKQVDAAKAMNEHERAQKAFHANRERLKALRLARETAKWLRAQRTQNLTFEPWAAGRDLMWWQAKEPIMFRWHDTMVDTPEADGVVYVTGWTISGLATLAVIFAVWVFAI